MARQDEYDREFLEYEDPAIYKALMQQEASEQRPTYSNTGTMVQNLPDNVYRSGKGRRAVASALGNIIGDDYATGLIGGGAVGKVPYGTKDLNKYAGLGALDAVGVGGAIDFVDSWKFFNKINAEKTRVENELIEEGYDKNSELFDDEVTKRMPEYHGKGEAFFYSLLAPLEIATFGQASKMVAGGRIVKNALNKKIDTISRKLMSLKGAPGALPVVAEATSGALPSGNLSDNIQAIRDSASKLRSEKGALPDKTQLAFEPDDLTDSIKALQSSAESLKSKKKIKLNPIKKIDNLSESTQDVISSLYFSPDHLRHILDTDKDYARDYLTDLLAGDLTPDRYGYFQESLTKDPVPEELFNNVKKELYNQTQAFLNLNKYSDVIDVYRIGDISKGEIQSFTLNPRFSGESLPWAKDKTLKKYKVKKEDILGSTDIKDPWMEQEILINSDSLRS